MSKASIQFREEARRISESFPELRYVESGTDGPQVIGDLVLRDQDGLFIDSYHIRIEPGMAYPARFPRVFETGSRIPINIDWHVFPDGHCCIKSIPEESLICRQGITLEQFIQEQVKPFFFNQKYRELHGFFLQERAHGVEGNIAFFEDIFNTKDLARIARALIFIKAREEPKRTNQCFCGCKLKYRKCHKDAFRLLQVFSDEDLDRYIHVIVSSPRFKLNKS